MTFTLACVITLVSLFGVVVTLALCQRRNVKAGIKIPFATFFFEASDNEKDPIAPAGTIGQPALKEGQSKAK